MLRAGPRRREQRADDGVERGATMASRTSRRWVRVGDGRWGRSPPRARADDRRRGGSGSCGLTEEARKHQHVFAVVDRGTAATGVVVDARSRADFLGWRRKEQPSFSGRPTSNVPERRAKWKMRRGASTPSDDCVRKSTNSLVCAAASLT
jgi:hypothetical protein